MKKIFIAAFGGIITAGFLAIPAAPVANAGPCGTAAGASNVLSQACRDCVTAGIRAGNTGANCRDVPEPVPGQGILCPPNIDQITGQRGPVC